MEWVVVALLLSQALTTVQLFLMRRRVDNVERSIRPPPQRDTRREIRRRS